MLWRDEDAGIVWVWTFFWRSFCPTASSDGEFQCCHLKYIFAVSMINSFWMVVINSWQADNVFISCTSQRYLVYFFTSNTFIQSTSKSSLPWSSEKFFSQCTFHHKKRFYGFLTGEPLYLLRILTPFAAVPSVMTGAGLIWDTDWGVKANSSVATRVAMWRDDLSVTRRQNCFVSMVEIPLKNMLCNESLQAGDQTSSTVLGGNSVVMILYEDNLLDV